DAADVVRAGAREWALLGIERSLSGKRWRQRGTDDRMGLAMAQRLGVPEVLGRLLAARGVAADNTDVFLSPTLRALLPDPSRFLGMDAAVERLGDAVGAGPAGPVFGA